MLCKDREVSPPLPLAPLPVFLRSVFSNVFGRDRPPGGCCFIIIVVAAVSAIVFFLLVSVPLFKKVYSW